MADPRLIAISLDEATLGPRSPEIERERLVAMQDIVAGNRFAPRRPIAHGHLGPYRATLRVEDGRLAIDVADAAGGQLETIILGLTRFRRAIRDYAAIRDSYFAAVGEAQAAQIETIDMARRAIHNGAAEMLMDCLAGKIAIDFDTARRLFTLIAVLHVRG